MHILLTPEQRTLTKLNGLPLTLWQAEITFFHAYFKMKREHFGPRHCLTKCALENKLLNQNCRSWYHLSQAKLPHTLICDIVGSMPFRFMGHPVYCSKPDFPFIFSLFYTNTSERFLCRWYLRYLKLVIYVIYFHFKKKIKYKVI